MWGETKQELRNIFRVAWEIKLRRWGASRSFMHSSLIENKENVNANR